MLDARVTHRIYPVNLLVLGVAVLTCVTGTSANEELSDGFSGHSFSVYVLSRGKGVPDPAWKVLEEMRQMLRSLQVDGVAIRIVEDRIGLEGERRLCAEFIDEEIARATWLRAKLIGSGVDLINVKVEVCTR